MSETRGILVLGKDKAIESGARREGLPLEHGTAPALPFDRTLIVEAGTRVPWDLLPAAWHFLERWDAAVPLWRYGKTAEDVGTAEERKRTRAVVRDLRVLLHSVELLFVRNTADGRALVGAYVEEMGALTLTPQPPLPSERERGGERPSERERGGQRLAFLRAFYRVKPRMCVLPMTWMAEVAARAAQDEKQGVRRIRADQEQRPLVRVEIAPGRFVKCYAGDEEQVRARYANTGRMRHDRQ